MTYADIIKLAIRYEFSGNDKYNSTNEQLNYVEQLVIDINDAIEDRIIYPINVDKPESKISDSKHYIEPIKIYGAIAGLLICAAMLKWLWNDTSIRNAILRDNPDADIWEIITRLMLIIACSVAVPLLHSLFTFINILALKAKSDTPIGMIKYQVAEAKNRKYASAVYFTDSVIDFLDEKYNYEINKSWHGYSYGETTSVWEEGAETSNGCLNNKLIADTGLRRLFYDKKKSEKMARLANIKHRPLTTAKENIIEFIINEVPSPCTCYHNQIARYILKNQNKAGIPSITYTDYNGVMEKISENILRKCAKEAMEKVDPSRVYSKTIALKKCEKHRIM
ncbi:hypothetical protein [Geobacter sp. AOG1]|uniref:hypothetical protein n=1 Tax=Geobacter sp. AOG1 TaxID=1566346 RepID=UPI001CC74391|nr:hypothetical protein [Geobacter sp. AOG1]